MGLHVEFPKGENKTSRRATIDVTMIEAIEERNPDTTWICMGSGEIHVIRMPYEEVHRKIQSAVMQFNMAAAKAPGIQL